jgi:glucose uptake protein
MKGIVLALAGGLALGSFAPLLLRAQDPQDGVGPYSLLFLFSIGVVVSTFVYNLFFMNLPVEGDPLEISDYLKTPVKNHLLGLLGGAVWGAGAIATFVANTPKGDTPLSGPINPMLSGAAPLVTALWGIFIWREFKSGDIRAKSLSGLMLVFFVIGLAFFSTAAVSGK